MQITVKKKRVSLLGSLVPGLSRLNLDSVVSCDVNERFFARTAGNLDEEESYNSKQSENISYLRTEYVGNHTAPRGAH